MLDNNDIKSLTNVLANKRDVSEIRDELKTLSRCLITAVDGLVTRVEALNQEYFVLRDRDSRYERWFREIAEKVGVTLIP